MKKLIIAALAIPWLLPAQGLVRAVPDCQVEFNLTSASSSDALVNRLKGCVNWTIAYSSSGFSALTLTFQHAPPNSTNGSVPGTWTTFGGTTVTGANPMTTTTQTSSTFTGYYPYLRVTLSGLTGSGAVVGVINGWRRDSASAASGGNVGGASNLTTAGAIPFVASAGVLTQDATNLFWDSVNKRLGLKTNSPTVTLDIGGSTRVYDQTATTGVTTQTIRAGAGQSTTKLVDVQNNAGSTLWSVRGDGQAYGLFVGGPTDANAALENVLITPSDKHIAWSSTTNWYGPLDTAIRRTSAGLLAIDNGTAGQYRDLQLRNLIQALTTPASASAAGVAGTITADTGYVYVCTATNTWKRVAIATW